MVIIFAYDSASGVLFRSTQPLPTELTRPRYLQWLTDLWLCDNCRLHLPYPRTITYSIELTDSL